MRFKSALAFIFALSVSLLGKAQHTFAVTGAVTDSTKAPISDVTVRLIAGQDTLATLTAADGAFRFRHVTKAAFMLNITAKGFKEYIHVYSFDHGYDIQLDPIILAIDYRELDPVLVKTVKPFSIRQDTIEFRAAAFSVRDGSEIESLLKKLPGIEVNMSGKVVMQGKTIDKVMINGKSFFGGDVLTATRNLPADIVDKIQVIDDYGDKARLTGVRSGESIKVLNIILKEDRRTGNFGRLEAGHGNLGKYTTNVFENLFNRDRQVSLSGNLENNTLSGNNYSRRAGLSYADRFGKHWTAEHSLNYSAEDPSNASSMTQDNYYPGGQLHQEQTNRNKAANRTGNMTATYRFTPDPQHTLRISPSLSFQNSIGSVASVYSTSQQDSGYAKYTSGDLTTAAHMRNITAAANIYYEQLSVHSKNRFSVQVITNITQNLQDNHNILHSTTLVDTTSAVSLDNQLVNNNTHGWMLNASTNYYIPFGTAAFLELGYMWLGSDSRNGKLTRKATAGDPSFSKIDSLSNDYFFFSALHKLHVGYTARFKSVDMTLSLDGQPGSMRGSNPGKTSIGYRYFSLAPAAQFTLRLPKSQSLAFQYNGSPELPGLQQLQPQTDVSNPQYPVKGNPSLKPAYAQSFNLRYERSTLQLLHYYDYGINLGYNTISNVILTNLVHPKDTGTVIQETTYLNAGTVYTINSGYYITLPAQLNGRLKVTLNGNLSYAKSLSMTDGVMYPTTSRNWTQNVHFLYAIPEILESDISADYGSTRTAYHSDNTPATLFSSAQWSASNKHFLWRRWILFYSLSQNLTSGRNAGLQSNPALLTAALQRQFLKKNRLTASITADDLLNSAKAQSLAVSPTSAVTTRQVLNGRSFMFRLLWKWGKF